MNNGKFIVIEGGEGAGKGICIEYLKNQLKNNKIFFTREPGGTVVSESIRDVLMNPLNREITPLTETFLFCSARAQHVEQLIEPTLKRGQNVICDRFDYSTIAYQIFGRRQFKLKEAFYRLNSIAKKGIEPNLVIYLDVDPEIGLLRKEKSEEGRHTRFNKEKLEFHQRVREGYLAQFNEQKSSKDAYWYFLSTTDATEDLVKNEVLNVVKTCLRL